MLQIFREIFGRLLCRYLLMDFRIQNGFCWQLRTGGVGWGLGWGLVRGGRGIGGYWGRECLLGLLGMNRGGGQGNGGVEVDWCRGRLGKMGSRWGESGGG